MIRGGLFVPAFIALLLGIITGQSHAQTFTQQTGASNPINGEDVGEGSKPTFVDIDGDSDFDAFIGESNGAILYYENQTLSAAPGGVTSNLALWLKADAGVTESSGDVSAWADQSSNGNDASQGTPSQQPDYATPVLNYNPGIAFDGTDDFFDTSLSINASTKPDVSVFSVYKPDIDDPGAPWGDDNGNWGRFIIDAGNISALLEDATSTGATGETNITNLFIVDQAVIALTEFDEDVANGSSVYVDGTQQRQFTASHDPLTTNDLDIGRIGNGTNPRAFDGDIYEVIVYEQLLSSTERNQVHSYLALKYGILLSHDYLASDGTTLWNATTNATYHNDVAGIGRDDASGLAQRQSTSQTGGLVEIGLGTLAADNASNGNAFSADDSFLIWGHDNASSSVATAFSGTNVFTRMARIWTVEETGTVGTVEVQIPDTYDATYLIVSSNSSLTSPTEYALTDNGDGTRSVTVDFSDGEFFSFGTGAAPGGVISGLELWLKADAGVTESSGDVSAWADQSSNGNDASQGTPSQQPDYATPVLNYNPGIAFDGTDDFFDTSLSINASTKPDVSVFSVYKPDIDDPGAPWGDDNGNWGRFIIDAGNISALLEDATSTGATGETNITNLFIVDQAVIALTEFDEDVANGSSVYVDGTQQRQFTASHDPLTTNDLDIGRIGNGTNPRAFDGDIYEVIVYEQLLSSTERNQVHSYLALKYGILLSHDYLASDGTTLWNATTNATYHNNVAGIGRDDASALNQKQSDSDILSVALGSLAADNASNANSFSSDLAFLVMGHNGGALTESSTTAGINQVQVLGRIWLAEETSESGTLEVQVDLSTATVTGTTAADFQLVLDTNTDPSDGYRSIVNAASFSSNIATFSSVDIEDGDYLIVVTYITPGSTIDPLTDGQAADGVLGQADFTSSSGSTAATTLNGPTAIAVGPTGKVFVSDTQNNRILRWSSASATTDGSSAEAVLGQADFTSSSANRGGSVAANTLYEPTGIYVTSSGALYVADTRNNRILRFDNAESASDGANADGVLGQGDFTSNKPNRRRNVAVNSVRQPKDVYVDASGNLWVADFLNHRVLRFDNVAAKSDGADADGVLGQESFTTNQRVWKDGNTDADSFVYPSGVFVDGNGVLWVADAGNSRVLRFDSAASKADGADADGVLGQNDFTSWEAHKGGQPAAGTMHWPDAGLHGDNNDRLYVTDRWGDRLLWYHSAASKANGADADGVVGQPSFTSRHGLVDNDSFNSATDIFVDPTNDYIWVVDNAHNRVLRFDGSAAAIGKRSTATLVSQFDLWLKANEGVFADTEGDALPEHDEAVRIWVDQSLRRFTAVSSLPPIFVEDAINGYPALAFDDPEAAMIIYGGLFGETTFDHASVWAVRDLIPGSAANYVLSYSHRDTEVQYGLDENRHIPPPQRAEMDHATDDLLLGSPGTTGASLAEMMVSFRNLSTREQHIITSHLALKYGFTIDHPYLNAQGDTLWADAIYNQGIAGIGRDDALGLAHYASTPYGDAFPVTIAVTPVASGEQPMHEGSFLLWAHNGGALSMDQVSSVQIAPYRMSRTWKLQTTGSMDSVHVYLPGTARAEYLLLGEDAAFSNPATFPLQNTSEGILYTKIPAVDGRFLTLASTTRSTETPDIPEVFALHPNYPNPFNASTTIAFDLPEAESVSLIIYDILGRQVMTVMDEEMLAGRHRVTFIPDGLASGIYLYAVQAGGNREVGKMIYRR